MRVLVYLRMDSMGSDKKRPTQACHSHSPAQMR